MKEQITRGMTFVRETTYYIEAFWSEEGGMGEEEYCECEDIRDAFVKLEEAQMQQPDMPWRITIYVNDTKPEKTETRKLITERT